MLSIRYTFASAADADAVSTSATANVADATLLSAFYTSLNSAIVTAGCVGTCGIASVCTTAAALDAQNAATCGVTAATVVDDGSGGGGGNPAAVTTGSKKSSFASTRFSLNAVVPMLTAMLLLAFGTRA